MGEQSEHLWSRGKPLFKVARYMTPANWWDSINMWLELLTALQLQEFPKLLHGKVKNVVTKLSEC